jgi:hypothetical protein
MPATKWGKPPHYARHKKGRNLYQNQILPKDTQIVVVHVSFP